MTSLAAPTRAPLAYRALGVIVLAVAAGVALVLALAFGGAANATLLLDAGPVVRWGLPTARLLNNLSAAAMLGVIVLALFALKAGTKAFERALDIASAGAALYTVTSAVTGFLVFMDSFAPQLSIGREFGALLGNYLVKTELGMAWLITTLIGAVVTVCAFAGRSWTAALLTALLAAASLLPIATQGHSGDLSGHAVAVNSILIHTVAAAVWVGGLLLVVLLRRAPEIDLQQLVRRYSALALAAFVAVALSGLFRSTVAFPTPADILSPYGGILLAKAALLIVLGIFGAWYRLRVIPRLDGDRSARAWWMLVLAELAIMGLASGAAAALARTAPPAGTEAAVLRTPAERLTDAPLPPEFTTERWFTEWSPDVLWLILGLFGLFFYLAGVVRLTRRGDRWPIYRTVFWVLGILLLMWVTSGPINAYQDYLFSVHMLGHMLLSMGIPALLVAGSPLTLALRAAHKRDDGTRGGREWIMWAVHTPFSKVITHPLVAAGIFIGSLWVFYYTDLFRWSLYEHLGHEWMVAHFLISGYLFSMSLVGIDPVPYRMPHAGRLLTLIGVMAMHAFFGVAIMMQSGLMVAEWFGAMGRTWGVTPLQDQYIGGGVAWSIGEIPTLIVAITVAIQWSRSDTRLQRRRDRHADRTGDAELQEYNERLAKIAERDRRAAERAAQR